jgi:outer membrane lipoprotein SlyB
LPHPWIPRVSHKPLVEPVRSCRVPLVRAAYGEWLVMLWRNARSAEVAVRLVSLRHPCCVAASTITARDPGWADQLLPIAIASAVAGGLGGLAAGWKGGVAIAVLVAAIAVAVVARFFDRRTLRISGTHIVVTDPSGTYQLDVSDLTGIEAGEVFHVGKRVDLIAPRVAIGDVDPGSARNFLLAIGQALVDLGRQDICSPAARPFLGL